MLRAARPCRVARPRPAGVRRLAAAKRPLRVLLIALGLLFAQGPMLLHLLLVQHATCEHGELVDVSRQRGEHEPLAREQRAAAGQAELSDSKTGSGHKHCDALAVRHQIPEVGSAVAGASLVWIEPVAEGGERAEWRVVPILSLAPKGSPPAV
jgi:hypothetical protein